MTSIDEATVRLLPIIQASIKCYSMNTELYPLQEAGHDLQIAAYWLLSACKELAPAPGETLITEDALAPTKNLKVVQAPTLIGTPNHLEYMANQLDKLQQELQIYTNTEYLPPTVLHKVNQGWNKIMEAYFNTQLATNYYGELNKRERGNQ